MNRDADIIAKHNEGWKTSQLANYYGLSERRINEIVREGKIHQQYQDEDKWLVIGDCHMPEHDSTCIKGIIDFAKDCGAHKLILLGDILNLDSVSRWRGRKKYSLVEEVCRAKDALHNEIIEQNNWSEIEWVLGNHDERLEKHIEDVSPQLLELMEIFKVEADVASLMGLKDKCKIINNMKLAHETGSYHKKGKLYFLHGHEIKAGSMYPARAKLNVAHDNIIFAHHHKVDTAIEFDLSGKPRQAWSVGCSCYKHPLYNPSANRWQHGCAIVRFRDGGKFSVDNKVVVNGEVY